MMPGSKGQKAVHACMIRLLNLGPAKHEEEVICVANQRIPNVCRIAGAACCGAIRNEIFRGHQLGAKDLLTPTSLYRKIAGIYRGIGRVLLKDSDFTVHSYILAGDSGEACCCEKIGDRTVKM